MNNKPANDLFGILKKSRATLPSDLIQSIKLSVCLFRKQPSFGALQAIEAFKGLAKELNDEDLFEELSLSSQQIWSFIMERNGGKD